MRHLISAIPIYITNICGKFHLNPITYFRDIVSCKISVNARTDRQTETQPENTSYCRWWSKA